MKIEEARQRVAARLGSSKRAEHSIVVGHLMRALAERLHDDVLLWEVVGLCHDLDFFETAGDRRQHGVLAAQWLANELPPDGLEAIRAHDHRTGIGADTPIADALKLADALAIADEGAGRETIAPLLSLQDEDGLRSALAGRPHLPAMIITFSQKLGLSLADIAPICRDAPRQ